ncbi:MAG TPA: FecR domain-containing protein [Puia sp.]|jgi:ferric-dicitrate binding protein FerR (iron transport regulator)
MIITRERIVKFLEDRCSAEEADEIYRYLQENPEWIIRWFNEDEWESFRHTEDLPQNWSQEMLEKIDTARTPRKDRVRWMTGLKVAATITGILLGSVFVWQRYAKKGELPRETMALSADAGRDTTLINGKGTLQRVILEDGSVVVLSPASRLSFHRGFQQNKRTVFLSGEAVFRVAEEKARPFTVFTRGFSTTVLGTEFRIRAYADSSTSSIQLLSGKVMVRNLEHPDRTACLSAGQQCEFDNKKNSLSRAFAIRPADPSYRNEAMSNSQINVSPDENDREILFKNESLARVLSRLSEFYRTPVHFNRAEMNKRKFTGSVQKDQSLEEALKIITLLNDLHIDRKDSIYQVIPGR